MGYEFVQILCTADKNVPDLMPAMQLVRCRTRPSKQVGHVFVTEDVVVGSMAIAPVVVPSDTKDRKERLLRLLAKFFSCRRNIHATTVTTSNH
mmetsp:Transcript_47343/g.110348  ORF Transcript_47343/g.110348 Transcript_47343/m.110348 type:complete len:93 (+) Transcript_47343:41-319(+)